MPARLLGFPLIATAQARRGLAPGCPAPLVDFRCAACGQGVGFAAWSDTLALVGTTCRRCGEVGRWQFDRAEAQAGSDASPAPAGTCVTVRLRSAGSEIY